MTASYLRTIMNVYDLTLDPEITIKIPNRINYRAKYDKMGNNEENETGFTASSIPT